MSANRDSKVLLVLGGVGFVLVLLCGGSMALFQQWRNRPPTALEAAVRRGVRWQAPPRCGLRVVHAERDFRGSFWRIFGQSLSSKSRPDLHSPKTLTSASPRWASTRSSRGSSSGISRPYTGDERNPRMFPALPYENFYVLNTSKHEVAYFSDRAEWSAACAQSWV